MAQRGGKRPGAGRPPGSKDRATRDQGATIAELARKHCSAALDALVQIATGGESEAARVAAANALLDRGFGKPTQAIDHSGRVEHAHEFASAFARVMGAATQPEGDVGSTQH